MDILTHVCSDDDKRHRKSMYHVVVYQCIESLKDMLEKVVKEYVTVSHISNLTSGIEGDEVDTISFYTFSHFLDLTFNIHEEYIIITKFKHDNKLTYDVIDDFLDSFISNIRRLYDIKSIGCHDFNSSLLREWMIKNNGVVYDSWFRKSIMCTDIDEFDGIVNIDSKFNMEEYTIHNRRDVFKYLLPDMISTISSKAQSHLGQTVIGGDHSHHDNCEEFEDSYVGSVMFRVYGIEILCIDIFKDMVGIMPFVGIPDVYMFLNSIVSTIVSYAQYFVDIGEVEVLSVPNDEISRWCNDKGLDYLDESTEDWSVFNIHFLESGGWFE